MRQVLAIKMVSALVCTFPNLHRPQAASLSSLSLSFLNGSPTTPIPAALIKSACRLQSSLHVTGGKVGGSVLWRKSVDETLDFISNALTALQKGTGLKSGAFSDSKFFLMP